MSVDFEVRGQQGMDCFTGGKGMDFGQKRLFKDKMY